MSQAGSWKDINATGESGLIDKNVFSVWINHGLNPENASYQYIVVPDKSINAFRDLAEQIDFYIAQMMVRFRLYVKAISMDLFFIKAPVQRWTMV